MSTVFDAVDLDVVYDAIRADLAAPLCASCAANAQDPYDNPEWDCVACAANRVVAVLSAIPLPLTQAQATMSERVRISAIVIDAMVKARSDIIRDALQSIVAEIHLPPHTASVA